MKNTYSLAERNRIVEEYLPYVDQVIRRNRALMRASRLEYDDVYQQLSLRLIRAVSTYDPNKGELGAHILAQLRFELLNCKAPPPPLRHDGTAQGFLQGEYHLL